MNDEEKSVIDESTEKVETPVEGTTKDIETDKTEEKVEVDNEKKFSQDDMNKYVQIRLGKEKKRTEKKVEEQTAKTYEQRITELEEAQALKELQEKAELEVKKSKMITFEEKLLEKEINPVLIEEVKTILHTKIGDISHTTQEELKEELDKLKIKIPDISKNGVTKTNQKLQQAEVRQGEPKVKEEKNDLILGKYTNDKWDSLTKEVQSRLINQSIKK